MTKKIKTRKKRKRRKEKEDGVEDKDEEEEDDDRSFCSLIGAVASKQITLMFQSFISPDTDSLILILHTGIS